MKEWITKLFACPELTQMGHLQTVEDANLGLGWVYYGLARIIRPKKVIVIGSYRGFVPLVLGKALADNLDGGEVIFLDPSLVDTFWKEPKAVREHFAHFEVTNIQHFRMTTQQFAESDEFHRLPELGMVFIDGYHSEEQVRFDYRTFEGLLSPNGVVLLHDSTRCEISEIYGPDRAYERRVKCFVDELKLDPRLQVLDLPFDSGVTLVRKLNVGEKDELAQPPIDVVGSALI